MIQSAAQYPISQIFDIDSKIKYVIPKFQREYIWKKEDWENLFNDILENEQMYFLGTIICVNKTVDALETQALEVIDGQQRLTTISLLYTSIYKRFLNEIRVDEDFITEKSNLKNRIIQKGKKNELKLELSSQNKNLKDYKSILMENELISNAPKNKYLRIRRLFRAYNFFNEKVANLGYEKLVEILDKLNTAVLVKIEVNNHSDAFILFESVNNRGQALSPMDLVKNNILSKMEKEGSSIDDAYSEWLKLVDNLPDYSIQERFLRQFYNAFSFKNEIKIKGITKATRSNLIKIYEKLIERKVGYIFSELISKSTIYNKFTKPRSHDNLFCAELLTDLLHIGAAPSYTFLLYLSSEHMENNKVINESVDFLIKYFVRRNLTDFPATRDLDSIFIGLINECERYNQNLTLKIIRNYLTDSSRFVNEEVFEEKLRGSIYEDNVAVARFILCKIEENYQTKETKKDLWERDKRNRFIWTIEHILPKGERIPPEWVDMIANGDKDTAKKIQSETVHALGNLTISVYNSSLSNFSFEKKRDRMDKQGRHIGYKNGLYLNGNLKNEISWTLKHIERRTNELVKEALTLFHL